MDHLRFKKSDRLNFEVKSLSKWGSIFKQMFEIRKRPKFREALARKIYSSLSSGFRRKYINQYPQMAVFAFDYIGMQINMHGRYEKELLEDIQKFLDCSDFEFSGTCLDIGANIGNHAVFFSDLFDEIIAFEPNPRTYELLKFNTANRNITCNNFGLSDSKASLPFCQDSLNMGASMIVAQGNEASATQLIEVEKLDDFAQVQEKNISLVKMDVEGHEAMAVKGARQTLQKNLPIILFEQGKSEIKSGTSETIELLRELGYSFCVHTRNFGSSQNKTVRQLGKVMRFIFGTKIRFVRTKRFAKKNYPLILAYPKEKYNLPVYYLPTSEI